MVTLFDWSDIPEPDYVFAHRNEDGTVDWRKRCLHLAHAADALQLAAINATASPGWAGPRDQIQSAGDLVYCHLEHLRADYQREQETETGFDDPSYLIGMEVERITPALARMIRGIRSDDRIATIVQALADAIQDSSAEVGEDASQEVRDLRSACRRWSRDHE